jgi:3-hydroxyisobutyrate dehydrogenase
MSKISFLGLGAMGSRMASNLLKAGHSVTVWNRTPYTATALVSAGATLVATPKEAATSADFVIAMLRDNDASREVWLSVDSGALTGMKTGAVAIESSTLTPSWTRELGGLAAERSVKFLEAPVVGSRPQAEAAKLIYYIGGDESTLKLAEPVLKAMGESIHFVGPIGSGALVKLATNALLGVQVTALAELIGLLRSAGADVAAAIKAISSTAAWSPAANNLSASMLTRNFAPQFPIELIEKDFGYAVDTASSPAAVPTIAAARGVFQRAIESGLGEKNMTSVVLQFIKWPS